MKLFEDGLTREFKISAVILTGLLSLSIMGTVGLGVIMAKFDLVDKVPVWFAMTPLALFVGLLIAAIFAVVIVMIVDIVTHDNLQEYIELLNPFSQPSINEQESEFANMIFEGNDYR